MIKIKKTSLLLAGVFSLFGILALTSCNDSNAPLKVTDFKVANNSENIQSGNSIDFSVEFKNLSYYDIVSYEVTKTNISEEKSSGTYSDSKNTRSDSLRYFSYSPFTYTKGEKYELTKVNYEKKNSDETLSLNVSGFEIEMDENALEQTYSAQISKDAKLNFEEEITCSLSSSSKFESTPRYLKYELINLNDSKIKFEDKEYISDLASTIKLPSSEDVLKLNGNFNFANINWQLTIYGIELSNGKVVETNIPFKLTFKDASIEAYLNISENTSFSSIQTTKTINNKDYYSTNDTNFSLNHLQVVFDNTNVGVNNNSLSKLTQLYTSESKNYIANTNFNVRVNGTNNTVAISLQNYNLKVLTFVGFRYNNKDYMFNQKLNVLDKVNVYKEGAVGYYTASKYEDIKKSTILENTGYQTLEAFFKDNKILFTNSFTIEKLDETIFDGTETLNGVIDFNGKTITVRNQEKSLFKEITKDGCLKNLAIKSFDKKNNSYPFITETNYGTIQNIKIQSSNVTEYLNDNNFVILANKNDGTIKDIEIECVYTNKKNDDSVLNIYFVLNNNGKINNVIHSFGQSTFSNDSKNISFKVNPANENGTEKNLVLYFSGSFNKDEFLSLYNRNIKFYSKPYSDTDSVENDGQATIIFQTIIQNLINDLNTAIENGWNVGKGPKWVDDGKYETVSLGNWSEAEARFKELRTDLTTYLQSISYINNKDNNSWIAKGFEPASNNIVDTFWSISKAGSITLSFAQKTNTVIPM